MPLEKIVIDRDGVKEEFPTYAHAAARLGITAESLRTTLSTVGGRWVKRASPIGACVITRVQVEKG